MAMPMASTSSGLHELYLLRRGAGRRVAGPQLCRCWRRLGCPAGVRVRARSVPEDRVVVLEDEELMRKLDAYGRNGNGKGNGRSGAVKEWSDVSGGDLKILVNGNGNGNGGVAGNGSLVKYDNGNGNGAAATAVVDEVPAVTSESRRKTIEEIGQEEAWFKKDGKDQLQVSVSPGGRWNRFKTYSTIQRTLEIWGFVFTFLFKAWLINQKFSYRGGMTEEKKVQRRKVLAKWLKESILRLGPTFIKIGQQFSTRVDILAQEYVDQLSELQDSSGSSLPQALYVVMAPHGGGSTPAHFHLYVQITLSYG